MTAMLFCDGVLNAAQTALLEQLTQLDKRFVALLIQPARATADAVVDTDGEITRLFDARPGTFYLLRPDLHIAGRWKTIVSAEILRTAGLCLGRATP